MAYNVRLERLRKQYSDEREEILPLAWFFDDDIGHRVVKEVYVNCQIVLEAALKEKTCIRYVLVLSNSGKLGNPHAARYRMSLITKKSSVNKVQCIDNVGHRNLSLLFPEYSY